MKKVLVYVQHLLGIGHLHRTALITQALAMEGFQVTVVSGGQVETKIDFGAVNVVQLTPIKTDPDFSHLYDGNGKIIDEQFKQQRRKQLLSIYRQFKPDLVLLETYPFGRRQMRFELIPLLDEIQYERSKRPMLVCSIRDVIQPKSKTKRVDEIVNIITEHFDAVLVHGDKSFIRFEDSFPRAQEFEDKLFYTGYVTKAELQIDPAKRNNTILVSAGGGAVGRRLYQTALDTARLRQGLLYQWHVLVGNNISDVEFNQLLKYSRENVLIERNRSDFVELMSACAMSVSQAGYNTIMDILVTATKAVVIPFEGEAEKEQLIRAQALANKDVLSIIREKHLTAQKLIEAIAVLECQPSIQNLALKKAGAAKTASVVQQLLSSKTMN